MLHEPAEHAQRRPRLRPRQLVAYVERSIQMPKFRVRCDNPKTDFELRFAAYRESGGEGRIIASARTGPSARGHGGWRRKGCPHGSSKTSRSAPIGLGTDGATVTALRGRALPNVCGPDDALSLLDRPTNGPGSSRLAISANTVHGPQSTSIVVKSGARGPVMACPARPGSKIRSRFRVQIFSRKRSWPIIRRSAPRPKLSSVSR